MDTDEKFLGFETNLARFLFLKVIVDTFYKPDIISLMKHFTNKAWMITWENQSGYSRDYGIEGIFNKESEAKRALDLLVGSTMVIPPHMAYNYPAKTFKIQEVTLNGNHKLFGFEY